jgi:hypothetical protein
MDIAGGGIGPVQMFPDLIGKDQVKGQRHPRCIGKGFTADIIVGIAELAVGFEIKPLAPFA